MNFDGSIIPQGSDPWEYLSPEEACRIISLITDITDISWFLQTSKRFFRYADCVENLTSNTILTVPVSFVSIFKRLLTIDHKIIIGVDQFNWSLDRLQYAH